MLLHLPCFAAPPAAMGDAAHALLPSGPQLDPRITLNRSAEVQITDEEGDAFVAHLPNGFVDADGVARGRRGLKPSAYHGCWENTDAIPERITFKAVRRRAHTRARWRGPLPRAVPRHLFCRRWRTPTAR